jgi:hypothetical protein
MGKKFKTMRVYHSKLVHSIGDVKQGVPEGQFISLWECAIFMYEIGFIYEYMPLYCLHPPVSV